MDSPSHAQIRNTCRIPPCTNDYPRFTVQEVEAAVKKYKKYLIQGYFPKRWKEANLVLFNKTNREDTSPATFRPFCLLDALGNILDRLLTQRIFHHILKARRINQNQFGFTPGRSAPEAIIQLKNWTFMARDQGKHSVIISLDVQSAFSRVWWPLVLHNLKRMDCPKNLFGLTASFLDGRSISLQYGVNSISKNYTIGCPQGSNSGPLLWLLVINDTLEIDFPTDVRLLAYADDLYLFVAATGKQTIKYRATEALEMLHNWSHKARVQFAHEKTQLIPFGKKGRQKHPPYCSFVVAKSNRGLSGRVLRALYKRALERILVYAASAWWTGTVRNIDKINIIQRQVLLAITGAFRTTSTAALQVISGVEPADLVCELKSAVYKLKHVSPNVQFLVDDFDGLTMDSHLDTPKLHRPSAMGHKPSRLCPSSVPGRLQN
ncbi:Retrovirus-related Pol polyprotein from type-1 retrotransposable element R1 [Araneus ventricosus]|uniref:Retrovirus-related Pol polyprotein from type-1 retrotransposable element R1 n=1 Tax=Araneus ventricosus TaxID=182803 RepID=A0A4Y2RB27_ARAVE|nr:Retrovirus-related Pol polyprotein from type-1 retrotransposable element R1 [Araneus ventricosus]